MSFKLSTVDFVENTDSNRLRSLKSCKFLLITMLAHVKPEVQTDFQLPV